MIRASGLFRLSNSSTSQPGGVGEDTHFNIWFRGTWAPNTRMELNAYAGITAFGALEIFDAQGDKVDVRDYDITPVLALSFIFRF